MKNLSPTMSQAQKVEAWQSHLNDKGNEFKAVAQQAAVQGCDACTGKRYEWKESS